MPLLPFKIVHVTQGLTVRVSNHFAYSDFGIRDAGEMRFNGRRYVMGATPGTGFIERDSESHSYHQFVRAGLARQRRSYLRLLMGREPSFEKEQERVKQALLQCDDAKRRDILECYQNALTVARQQEQYARIIRGVKDRMGHHSNKFMVSVISHYKSKIHQLEHDMKAVEYGVKEHCTEATFAAYEKVLDAFFRVASCRRIWQYDERFRGEARQVFFDMGVFDFIRSDGYLPLMRDLHGRDLYLLPDCLLVVRSSVDFDVLPLKRLTIVAQEMAIEEPMEMLSSSMGDAAAVIKIPELGLTYYFNHVRPVIAFVEALDQLKETL